jgi:hypothetical protein
VPTINSNNHKNNAMLVPHVPDWTRLLLVTDVLPELLVDATKNTFKVLTLAEIAHKVNLLT